MRFLIKFPTRERPLKFKECIKNIKETIGQGIEYRLLVTLDENDETMKTQDIKDILAEYQHYYGNSHNKIDAVNRDMIMAGRNWDILIQVSDDMTFVTHDWGKKIIEYHGKYFTNLDCYFHFNDGHCGQRMCTMQIMGREYFERTGTIYPPIYKTIYADAEAMYVAMLLGKHVYIPDKIFEHRHPANGYHNSDPLYDKNNQGAGDDQMIYEERRNKLFYVTHPKTIPSDLQPWEKGALSQ